MRRQLGTGKSLSFVRYMPGGTLPCPSCGFLTLEEETYGSYNICPVCGWEDDGVQLANPTSGGGANSKSLAEAQQHALELVPAQVGSTKGFTRSPKWRPLSPQELAVADARKSAKHWHSQAVLTEAEAYWSSEASGHNT